jgi:hypothetical protein
MTAVPIGQLTKEFVLCIVSLQDILSAEVGESRITLAVAVVVV